MNEYATEENSQSLPDTAKDKPVGNGKVIVDMSANGQKCPSNPETVKEKYVENGKVGELKSNFDNLKVSTENGSERNQEESNSSTENIIEAFFCTVDNQRKELEIIEKNLFETIQKLQISLRENIHTSESVKNFLREQIEQGMILLREIKITLSLRKSREKSIRLQLAKFHERISLKDSEESADGLNLAESFMPPPITDSEELDETSDEDIKGKRQMELNFIKTILKAARIRQKMSETEDFDEKEESNTSGNVEERE